MTRTRKAAWLAASTIALAALALAGCGGSTDPAAADPAAAAVSAGDADFAGTVDIGAGRRMYIECRGSGSPTVVLVSGLDTAADLWNIPDQPGPKVFPALAKSTRVCAYDRPGAPRAVGGPSRSDPVAQPTSPEDAVSDLHALLAAADVPGPYILVGHSYGGIVSRLFAATYPEDVSGMVLVDIVSPELRDAMTPAEWATWKLLNARKPQDIAAYPDLERIEFDPALDQIVAGGPIRQIPLVVLSADERYGPALETQAANGELPANVPADFGYVIDRANKQAQATLARLVEGAKHTTETNSGHNMMIDNAPLVIDATRDTLDAIRAGHPTLTAPTDAGASSTTTLTPVVQSVHSQPRWYPGDDGRFHLQYELMLMNTVPLAVEIASLEVRGDGRRIEELSGDALGAAMSLVGSETGSTTKLPASAVAIVWLDLSFPSRGQIPKRVSHRLVVDVGPGLPVGPTIAYTGARATISTHEAVVIEPPLLGGRWVGAAGPSGPHRRALQAVNGHLRLSQRFAVDFAALLDGQGRSHDGDPDQSSSYFNYGQPVLAVGAGTIVEAVDGRPDQVPNHDVPLPPAEAGGNEVILKLGEGIYVGYGHLKPGSLRVRRGQHVRPGQILGELGNSGQSTGPHLHLQLMTRPSFLDADGLPFVIRRFRLDGFVPSLQAFLEADLAGASVPSDAVAPGRRRLLGLTGLDVVTFPSR